MTTCCGECAWMRSSSASADAANPPAAAAAISRPRRSRAQPANINVELPRDKLIVFTGLSGSGKSSLAFDTIYAEGQRRYVESLSRPTPASSSGRWTSPTSTSSRACRRRSRSTRSRPAATRARPSARSPRSTTTCACCTPASACSTARTTAPGCSARRRSRSSTASCCCPRAPGSRCWRRSCAAARASTTRCSRTSSAQGYVRARVDGEVVDIDEFLKRDERLARYEQHTIEVIVDRLVRREGIERRLTDSLETALKLAEGVAEVEIVAERGRRERDAHVQPAPRLPDVRHELRRAGAAQLLVQLAVRRVRDVRRARHDVRGRPRAGHPRPRPVDQRRARSPRGAAPTRSTSRGCSRPWPRMHGIDLDAPWANADRQAAEGHPARRRGQPHGQVQEPLRPQRAVHHGVRGRDPVDQAPPRGRRERLGPRAVRGLHARRCRARRAAAPG